MILAVISALSAYASPAPFPVFLKVGFSTILEFEVAPKKVVLGDAQSFQVERLDRSLVVRSLVSEATSNLFVYFGSAEPKLFVLTASDEADPTIYRKFEASQGSNRSRSIGSVALSQEARLRTAKFSKKKEFLTVEISVSATSSKAIKPIWREAEIHFKGERLTPAKAWAERREVQRDTAVRARFIFEKPDLPENLKGAQLILPVSNGSPLTFSLGRN